MVSKIQQQKIRTTFDTTLPHTIPLSVSWSVPATIAEDQGWPQRQNTRKHTQLLAARNLPETTEASGNGGIP